jgi:hypothetical protein
MRQHTAWQSRGSDAWPRVRRDELGGALRHYEHIPGLVLAGWSEE